MTIEEQAKLRDVLHIQSGDRIVSAWAENARGPGWQNQLFIVLVEQHSDGKMRVESVQMREATPCMIAIFDICAAAHKSLMDSMKAAEVTKQW